MSSSKVSLSAYSTKVSSRKTSSSKPKSQEKSIQSLSKLLSPIAAELQPTAPPTEKMDTSVMEVFDHVFRGSFESIPSPPSKLVRVFTSSTFTDTTVERNALIEEVYPALKEFCRETHGLDFQVVDMRWGVRDEATDDHMTTKLCVTEIRNCQRLSMGPNFVAFLCQKYGYRPLPSEVLSTEFEMLKRALRGEHEDASLLETWYIEDANAVPPQFILQPISSILVNFNNKRIPKLQEQDAAAWWDAEAKMQASLRHAAKMCYDRGYLTHEQMHNYFMSVTEREVNHGILKADDPNDHCLCYVRHINNIVISQTRAAAKFIDITHNQVNVEAQKLLSSLRDERVPAKLDPANIRRSTVEWAGRDGIDTHFHAEYIRQFCADFYHSITKMVNDAMAKNDMFRDSLFTEVLQHLCNGQAVSEMFFGRHDELRKAEKYIQSESNIPLIYYGENGCGKTSTLAKIASQIRGWYGGENSECEAVIVLRFLGTSPDSSSICPLLTSVCDQIACNYNKTLRGSSPSELSKLFQHFKRMMTFATEMKPLVIIFDSLDLLSKLDGAHELLWFPPTLPPHVKLFASITPDASRIGTVMKRLVEVDEQYVVVPPLGLGLALEVVSEWLRSCGRTLTARQWELVNKALGKCTLPLFVRLIYATVARWKSYSRPQETILFLSLQESIHALFDRTEAQHGKLLVSHALSYITAARSGVSDSEVEDLISLDDKVLDDIYQYHLPPVRRIPPLLWSRIRADLPGYLSERAADGVIVLNWYHEQFRSAAVERYFKNLNHLQSTHSAIADYFLGIWGGVPKPFQYTDMQKQRFGVIEHEGLADRKVPKQPNIFQSKDGKKTRYNTRKLNELPFHLLRSARTEELFSLCLFSYEFLYAKVCSFPLQAVIGDYEEAIAYINDADSRRQLTLVADALRLSASILSRHPYMLAFELIARLVPLAGENAHLSALLVKCDIYGPLTNCFLPGHHSFHSPGGPLKYSLEEHQFAVFGMELTSDRKMLVSTSNQFIIWDLTTGDIARVVNPNIDGIFFALSLTNDDRYAAAYTNNNQVIVMSLITGEYVSIEPDSLNTQMEIERIQFTSDNHLLLWSKAQYFIYDLKGRLVTRGAEKGADKNLVYVFYKSKQHVRYVTWSGAKDDWSLTMSGRQPDESVGSATSDDAARALKPFRFSASLAFIDDDFTHGFACVELDDGAANPTPFSVPNASENDSNFAVVAIALEEDRFVITDKVITNLEERANAIVIWKRPGKLSGGVEMAWLVAVTVESFVLRQTSRTQSSVCLRLPCGVRNIPIRPMHTTSAIALSSNDTIFVAGVRKYIYLWNVATQQLLRSVDAHFGRILNLCALTVNGQNVLLSSSLDHSIKMWNMENIFEKSFAVPSMDQPIEKILIARNNAAIAIAQTRKYLGLWDVRSHRYITTLVANVHGAVITDSLISSDGRHVLCIESQTLLVWDLRTQSVIQRMNAPHVHQIVYLNKEKMIGMLFRQVDTPEQKVARFTVYSVDDLSIYYSHEFPCRMFKNVAVQKDGITIVCVVFYKGHDSLQVINLEERRIVHKFRPRALKKQQKDVIVHRLIPMPHNSAQLIVMEGESKGSVWDVRNCKLLRPLPTFNGIVSLDGKLGLYAPNNGGLYIIDMKTGAFTKTLIGSVAEGVNDVQLSFTPTAQHVLYYHNGHKTLRAFRVLDGSHVGTFRPHAQLTCWACDLRGNSLVIGGQDGSLLTTILFDEKTHPSLLRSIAELPSRRQLAEHLHIPFSEHQDQNEYDLRNLGAVSGAVTRFKQLLNPNAAKRSHVCAIQ